MAFLVPIDEPKYYKREIIALVLIFILNLLINLLLIKFIDLPAVFIAYNISLLIILIYYVYRSNLPTFLLILGILPLAYIDNTFSLYFNYLLFQNIPLYIFFVFSIFHFFLRTKDVSFELGYLSTPVILITLYSCFLFIYGFIQNNILLVGLDELYQHLYYSLALPIIFLIKERKNYKVLFGIFAVTLLLICFEYILLNLNSNVRITTYHNVFLPFLLALFYSTLLFKKNTFVVKLLLIIGISIEWIASISINTRILWVCNLITMFIITYFYLRYHPRQLRWFKIISLAALIITIPLLLNYTKTHASFNPESTQERLQSLSDPLGDLSFLMRIEITQAAIEKFIQNPIFGEGFGNKLKFKVFTDTEVHYIDNSFLYFLWKGGIIGLILFSLLYYRIIKTSYFVFNRTNDINAKIISLSILGGFFSCLLYGLLSASLIGYKLNLLYAVIIGYLEFERKNLSTNEPA